jgi:type II secretory pathway pseudopilin PulG
MNKRNDKILFRRALTLLELVLAMVMITIIFAAVLPQFAAIRNNWDSKQGSAEALQNGRVLMDHISRNLSKAKRITAVSASTVTNGYIQFVDNNNVNGRYDIASADSYVEYGPVGTLADLAGPVSSLKFTCYDVCDNPLSPVTDANAVRLVKVDATITNSASMGQDKTFTTWVYLRTNTNTGGIMGCWNLDETSGLTAADGSGFGNNGTLVNGPTWNPTGGQIDGALAFDETDDYVNLGTNSSLNFGNSEPFTVAAWVKTTENYGAIVSFRSSTDDGSVIDLSVGYEGVTDDPGKAMFLVRQDGGGSYANVKGGPVSDGQWHHLAAVRGPGSTIELFLDGVSQGTGSGAQAGGAVTTDLRAIGSERRWVSAGYGTADQRYLVGTIDDVRIYDRALSAAEIAALANILRYRAFNETKASSDSNTSVIIPTPATNTGDLLIAAAATDGSTTISPPSGWTPINQGSDTGSQVTLGAWWRFAVASEPASHQFSWTGGQKAYGWMMRFAGHNPASPINIFSSASSSGSATPTSPAVTTTVGNCLILRLGAFGDDSITVDAPGLPGHTPITMEASGGSAIPVAILGSWVTGTTHTRESGSNRALIFIGYAERTTIAAFGLNSVTYGGQSMTEIKDTNVGSTGSRVCVAAYYLGESGIAAATSSTFNPTWSATPTSSAYASVFLSGVNQTTPIGATAGNGTTTGAPITTAALANGNGDMVIDAATCSNTGTYTVNNSFTEALELTITNADGVAGYKSASGTNETPSVTHSTSNGRQSLIGFVVQGTGLGTVSGGAGYVRQSVAGSSGTSTFTLGSSKPARTLTIAIAPSDPNNNACCQSNILP